MINWIEQKEIKLYETEGGRCPFSEWLEKIKDKIGRATIQARLNRIRAGNLGDCKSLGDGVFELRINFGPGYRVYYGVDGNTVVVLLIAGTKATQSKDIRKAKVYWRDYLG